MNLIKKYIQCAIENDKKILAPIPLRILKLKWTWLSLITIEKDYLSFSNGDEKKVILISTFVVGWAQDAKLQRYFLKFYFSVNWINANLRNLTYTSLIFFKNFKGQTVRLDNVYYAIVSSVSMVGDVADFHHADHSETDAAGSAVCGCHGDAQLWYWRAGSRQVLEKV